MAINVTALTSYVEEQNLPLIAKAVLGAKSAKMFSLQSDVKGPSALNLVGTDIALQDGSECGWNASGDTKLSQRVLTPAVLKINQDFCDKSLLKTWAQHEVRVAAGQKNLPFEEEFTNGIVDAVNEKLEKLIYQGDADNTAEFDGLIKILGNSNAITVSGATGTPAYTAIKEVYMSMPEAVIEKGDAVILVGAGMFRAFIQELVTANLYHYSPENDNEEYMLPGTNVRVVKVNGLNDTEGFEYVIGGRLSNMFYGTDAEGDENKFEFWYSQDNREFRLAIEFTAGVQVAYPDEIVFGKFSK